MTEVLEGEVIQKGRPPKDYRKYIPRMLEIMANGRISKASLCANLEIDKKTLNKWLEEEPEFLEAYESGRNKGQDWWEKVGIGGVLGTLPGKFSASTYWNMMVNLFPDDYKPKTGESTVNINATLIHDIERIQKLDAKALEQENMLLEEKIKLLKGE